MTALECELAWHQQQLNMYGKRVNQPRLTAVCGRSMDPRSHYQHPNPDTPWTPTAARVLRQVAAEVSGWHPNGLIANLYRSGQDSIDWHADNEPALGPAPTVVSVSYGATRLFKLRTLDRSSEHELELRHGDLVIMGGACQEEFKHAITKTTKVDDSRLSLTFRQYR
jgi:alkylated DNA repair dioxygenase AlkB